MSNGTDITRHRYYIYNANGQLTGITLPGNMTYGYTYDAYGNLTGVNGAGGAVKWNLTGYTGRRTVSETVLDNNTSYPFVKTHLLDQYGYLDSIYTSQNNDRYQDEDYNFSPMTGNLTSANNRMSDGETWNFAYDDLDRLTAVQENNQEIMEMVYASNGNISYKTDMGCYDYNSNSKPHAVQSIDNDEQTITLYGHEITYNLWGKVSTIWHYDETDFYYYTAEYGPDLEKVSSRYDKTYHIEYEKFQWGDYEEKTTDGVTTCFYYVNGADGLAGLHTVSSTQGGTETHTAAVMTDHLGSIISMADNGDLCYDVHYDVWGNREVGLPFYYSIERGFTGHDHIDGIGLIDMRGRMYDPLLGRFLSPDAFVQAPTDPQNYNRYSYCLNNPLKYTDPSGDKWSWNKTWSYLLISPLVPPGSAEAFLSQSLGTASNAALAGAIAGAIKGTNVWDEAMSKAKNSFLIDFGLLQVNENLPPSMNLFLLASRFSGELRQTIDGNTIAHIRNVLDLVSDVSYSNGATLVNMNCSENHLWGFTLGPYINSQNLKADLKTDPAFRHEFGHTIQSVLWGPGYLNLIAIPSLIGASFAKLNNGMDTTHPTIVNDHMSEWYETNANIYADHYCNIFDIKWSSDEAKQDWDKRYRTKYNVTWFWYVFAPRPPFTHLLFH